MIANSKPDSTRGQPVVARAPVRVDVAGGTLDLWPIGLLHPGASTLALAVSLRVEARVGFSRRGDRHELQALDLGERSEWPVSEQVTRGASLELLARLAEAGCDGKALTLVTRSPVRAGSGLGTSSALGVAALAAIDALVGRRRARRALVAVVRDVESVILGIPAGEQDHWAAVRGGALKLTYRPGGPFVDAVAVDVAALAPRLLIVDSGEGRSSGPSNWDMYRRRLDGEPGAVDAFSRIAAAGRAAVLAVEAGDWRALGRAMRDDVEARRRLSPMVMTDALDAIFEASRRAGSLGEKVCGAGGGGFALLLAADPACRARIIAGVEQAGGRIVDARPVRGGLTVKRAQSARNASGTEIS